MILGCLRHRGNSYFIEGERRLDGAVNYLMLASLLPVTMIFSLYCIHSTDPVWPGEDKFRGPYISQTRGLQSD